VKYLKTFDEFPKITMQDELAKFLWVNDDWIIDFSYIDIVKSAWHSCWTVAWAYIIAYKWLKELYWTEIPKRWEIDIKIQKSAIEDNAWVIWCVLSNITWATTDYWFWWIPWNKFNRRNLLHYSEKVETDIVMTRLDTNKSIWINYKPWNVVNPMAILMSAIKEDATDEDKKSFPIRFQNMVKTLFENMDKVIEIK